MKLNGTNRVQAPVQQTWDALLDPEVLVRALPGCERLVAVGENAYDMTVTAGVASIKGTYDGHCELTELDEPRSLVMSLQGAGAPGTIGATVRVEFTDDDGATTVAWDADAVVGGMVGGVGQRMLGSVAKRMAGEFFANVERAIADPTTPLADQSAAQAAAPEAAGEPSTSRVYAAPAAPSGQQDFLRGVAVGAGLVLAGVVAGGLAARRPR